MRMRSHHAAVVTVHGHGSLIRSTGPSGSFSADPSRRDRVPVAALADAGSITLRWWLLRRPAAGGAAACRPRIAASRPAAVCSVEGRQAAALPTWRGPTVIARWFGPAALSWTLGSANIVASPASAATAPTDDCQRPRVRRRHIAARSSPAPGAGLQRAHSAWLLLLPRAQSRCAPRSPRAPSRAFGRLVSIDGRASGSLPIIASNSVERRGYVRQRSQGSGWLRAKVLAMTTRPRSRL